MLSVECRSPNGNHLYADWSDAHTATIRKSGETREVTLLGLANRVNEMPVGTHKIIHLEDTILIIKSDESVVCLDCMTGMFYLDFLQDAKSVQAITTLAICGDEHHTADERAELYAIAEPAIANWPKECRPIP